MQLIFNLKRKLAGFLPLMLLLLLCPSVSAEAAIQHNQTGLTPETESADCMENGKLHHPEKGRKRPHRFNPEQFKRDLSVHITRKAEFTQEEAKNFFPIFFEMKDKQRALERQKNRTLRSASESDKNEKDCERVLELIEKLETKSMRIEKDYMKRLRSIVGARKLVKAMAADRVFGRRMFHQMTKKR